ncbi:MAG: ABC transporter ATP-binding protein [Desulfobacterales bacterium]
MLEVNDLHAYYGKSHIIQGISFSVAEGEIVSLLGRNGVGRSTTIKTIMGEVEHTGSIQFKGEEISGLPPHEIARRGLGYVPENRDIFPTMTTLQNLLLGEKKKGRTGRWSLEDMYTMFPNLGERSHVLGGMISGGEQQMLTICRTLMGDPDLIMIDEPTEGLAPKLVEQVANLLKEIANRGLSILLIEQKLAIAMEISKRVIVMGHGQLVFEGTPDELRADNKIRQEWLEV